MLTYMLHVMKNYPPNLLGKFDTLAEQLCISSITLGELHYGAEKSARRADNLIAIQHFTPCLAYWRSRPRRLHTTDRFERNWNVRGRSAVRMTCRSAVMPAAKD
jgi:hypothetical protein